MKLILKNQSKNYGENIIEAVIIKGRTAIQGFAVSGLVFNKISFIYETKNVKNQHLLKIFFAVSYFFSPEDKSITGLPCKV